MEKVQVIIYFKLGKKIAIHTNLTVLPSFCVAGQMFSIDIKFCFETRLHRNNYLYNNIYIWNEKGTRKLEQFVVYAHTYIYINLWIMVQHNGNSYWIEAAIQKSCRMQFTNKFSSIMN